MLRTLRLSLFALLAAGVGAAQDGRPTTEELGWLESFLMTSEERRASIAARLAGDLGAFRRLFWMRRDPTPDTSRNETLDSYLARVRLAERNFSEDGAGGGGGDRARVFVLLGLPVQTIPQPAEGLTPERRLWVYAPDPSSSIADGMTAQYFRDVDGKLWLENRAEVDAALEPLRAELILRPEIGLERDGDGRLRIPNLPAGGSSRARRVLDELSVGSAERSGFPFRVTPAYFRAGPGATYVALVVDVAEGRLASADDGQSAASVFAAAAGSERERAASPGSSPFRFETAHTRIQPAGAAARFEASLVLPPGRQRLRVGVVDEQSDAWGAAIIEIEPPAFPEADPGFSSVVLYSDTATVESGLPSPARAFQFGRTHFRPRPEGVFRRDETLGAFYFFYPGTRVEDGELPEVVAEYLVERNGREAGFVRPMELPTSTRQAAANAEIPLREFEPGSYRLRIRIRYGGETYETVAAFRLVG